MNLKLFKLIYQSWWRGAPPTVPYKHIVQIGDPVLRLNAKVVEPSAIKDKPMQTLLSRLYLIMKQTAAAGLSAPQIGISLRVFAIQSPTKSKFKNDALYEARQMEYVPLQVWINPEIKILDYNKFNAEECCESMKGFAAETPRYSKVLLTGLDHEGRQKSWEAKGWSARIIQHEMDHLNGKLFTDIMNPQSLCCTNWNVINQKGGRIYITFMPNQ